MECEAKYELTKKRCKERIFLSEIEVFGQETGGHICYISDFRQNRVQKRSSEMLGCKMDFFSKKTSFENFSPSQSRRQVSAIAPDLSFVPWHRVLYFNTCSRIISVSFYFLSLSLLFFFSL